MGMPVGGGFMKQFFDVKLLVTNLAPHEVEFADGAATITLPDGMSLAPTSQPQALTMPVADIPGGESAGADWVVRGDAPGTYAPSINYAATLQPFAKPVTLSAQVHDR